MDGEVHVKNALTRSSIRRQVIKALNSLTTGLARSSVLVQFVAVNTDTALSGSGAFQTAVRIMRDRTRNTTRANVHGALVGRLPVTSDWGLLGKRQVRLGLVDLLGLVGVLIDDRLEFKNQLVQCLVSSRLEIFLTFIRETSESAGTVPPWL